MKHCSFFCAGIWPFLIAPLLLLAPLLYFMWEPIEQHVAANATQSLSEQHSWAKVETFNRGRDVLLTGTAPNDEAVETAKKLALNSEGVRVVDFVADTPKIENTAPAVKLEPSSLGVKFTGGRVVLAGEVDSQTTVDALVAEAKSKYSAERIINQLRIGSNLMPLTNAIDTLALGVQVPDGVNLAINGDALTLTGSVNSDEARDYIESEFAKTFEGNIDNQITVNEELVANSECQVLLNSLLSNAKINFATGKAIINESSNDLLESMAKTAARCPDATFEVAGHTDSTGNLVSNMALSEQRAQAVVDRLVSLNLKAERFSARGYGPNQPVGDNSTNQGRAQNRRIEFKIKSNY